VTVIRASLVVLVAVFGLSACTIRDEDVTADLAEARAFNAYPVSWAGERFEDWDLVFVTTVGFASFHYGDCDPGGSFFEPADGGCAPPFLIEIHGLCDELDAMTSNPIWKDRRVRGAPVGMSPDGGLIVFTRRTQVRVYGEEAAALRLVGELRSLNRLGPRFGPDDPIPAPRPGVLEGTARFCP
jgi:hypothetical protein